MMKKCSKCFVEKDFESFLVNKRSLDGFGYWCKDCRSEYNKIYREENLESERSRCINYYRNNRTKYKKYKKENKLFYYNYNRIYKSKNKEKIKASHQKRRARKRDAEGSFDENDILDIYKNQNGFCYYCKCDIKNNYHI